MKKKLATICVLVFMCLCIFTGCNLWGSNGYSNLSAIVATNGDVKITREELINAYNSSGYYYDQYYGYTRQQAIEKTIDSLISREYLLRHIDKLAQTDERLQLSDAETYAVIKETWDYIDTNINAVVEQIRKELDLTKEELSTESENSSSSGNNSSDYKKKESYTPKFQEIDGRIVRVFKKDDDEYTPNVLPDVENYSVNLISSSEDYKRAVWNRYITILKRNQQSYNYSKDEMTNDAVFKRELNKTYKTNLDNKKLQKFESLNSNFGLDDSGTYFYVNDETLEKIIEKYKSTYNGNKELYNLSKNNSNIVSEDDVKNNYYNLLTTTSNREDFLYYGEPDADETLITCIHILVKLSENQTNEIKKIDENSMYKRPYIKDDGTETTWAEVLKENERALDKTYAYARTYDEEGKAIESEVGTSVYDLFYYELLPEINEATSSISKSSPQYVEKVVEVFDKYIYKYNQDTGIQNAKFDYIVGTKTSAMVKSFTEVVNKLYNNGEKKEDLNEVKADYNKNETLYFPNGVGFAGAISAPFYEQASNYSGYHIVLYTGTLENISANSLNKSNVFEKLNSKKTSIAYGQTLFEFLYDKVQKDTYNSYQTNLVNSIMQSKTQLNSSNYSDLLNG